MISAGFDGTSTALVWSIAPICGTFLQPWCGSLMDGPRWRRHGVRTLTIAGAIATSVTLVGFSLSQTMALALARCLSRPTTWLTKVMVKTSTTIWFGLLNVAIQPLQLASRAIIIQEVEAVDQMTANAWASRMQGVGSILGFLFGVIPLPNLLHAAFPSRFLIMSVVTSIFVLSTAWTTASLPPTSIECLDAQSLGTAETSREIGLILAGLPKELWHILAIQCFVWLGWFPLRTYFTRYHIAQMHHRSTLT